MFQTTCLLDLVAVTKLWSHGLQWSGCSEASDRWTASYRSSLLNLTTKNQKAFKTLIKMCPFEVKCAVIVCKPDPQHILLIKSIAKLFISASRYPSGFRVGCSSVKMVKLKIDCFQSPVERLTHPWMLYLTLVSMFSLQQDAFYERGVYFQLNTRRSWRKSSRIFYKLNALQPVCPNHIILLVTDV